MEVFALYGKSGTGKSYQAMGLCRKYKIDAIIDDGLLICENRVAAGVSAKRQATKIGAVKTALFTNEEHCRSVMEAIKREQPRKILLLGTSEEMVERIAKRLELPAIQRKIRIEDITTPEEREEASRQRNQLGKHVIPVPTFQIKRQFSGYFLDPLRILRGRGEGKSEGEKTVVRPTYSYLGGFDLSDKVLVDIVHCTGNNIEGISTIPRVATDILAEGVHVRIAVTMRKGIKIIQVARQFQKEVKKDIEMMTAFNVESIDVEIRALK